MATLSQFLCFSHEKKWIEHNTIANDIDLTTLEDTGWNGTEHILLSVEFKGMTSIRTALESGNNIVVGGQYIHHLAFSLVAPLETEQYIYFHQL